MFQLFFLFFFIPFMVNKDVHSRLAARGPNSKWNASEIVHKNNKNQIKQYYNSLSCKLHWTDVIGVCITGMNFWLVGRPPTRPVFTGARYTLPVFTAVLEKPTAVLEKKHCTTMLFRHGPTRRRYTHPCSRVVNTGREHGYQKHTRVHGPYGHGPWTRVVCTGL